VTSLFTSFRSQIFVFLQIILPNTVCEGGNKTKLFQLLSDHYDESNLTTIQRKYFNESKGNSLRVLAHSNQ
jgi:DNA mismatch repair protein MSH4